MNNYHTFLIRSDYVTQLAAHLLAGILAFILVASVTAAPKEPARQETPEVVRLADTTLPAATPLLANR